MDIYNEGWQPEWSNPRENKYCIKANCHGNACKVVVAYQVAAVLAFKDEKTANLFLETFKDLLEEAKPLL